MTKKLMMMVVATLAASFGAWAETETVGNYTWTYTIDGDVAYIYNGGEAAVSPLPTGSVTIPGSLGGKGKIRLGWYALKNCTGLKSVTFPASVTYINPYAFDGCGALKSFSVASGNQYFKSVNGLLLSKDGKTLVNGVNGDVEIPDGVEFVGWGAFRGLAGLTSVTISQTVTDIENWAFGECSALTSVELPSALKEIAADTFHGCTSLKNAYIGNSVTNIGASAFRDCTSLSSVHIPSSVKSIGDRAFDGAGLTEVHFDGRAGKINADFNSAFTNTYYRTVVNANDDFDGAKTISGASGLVTGLNIFATDESNEPLWKDFDDSHYTMWFKWTAPSSAKAALFHTCHSDFDTVLGVFKGSSLSSLTKVATDDDACDNNTSRVKFAVTGGATYYICVAGNWGRGSFRLAWTTTTGSSAIVSAYGTLCGVVGDCPATLNIPSSDASGYSILRIADNAFNCGFDPSAGNITKVTIPDSVTSVGRSAFSGCNDSVFDTTTIPGVKMVDGWAVGKTTAPSGNLDLTGARGIAGNVFSSCKNLTSVTIPSTVKGIGNSAFSYCTGLTDVTIPASVKFLGENAFYDCNNLKNVRMPLGLYEPGIETWTFGACHADLSITCVDSSTGAELRIKDGVLTNAKLNGATSVAIPNGVTGIGENAFYGLAGLESVMIPASVVDINPWAFDGCSALKSFTVASGNRKYKASANGLLLTKDGKTLVNGVNGAVAIPDGVEVVGDYAFYNFGNLTSVAIPASVAEIKEHAFFYCSGLKSFTVASGNNNYKAVNGLLLSKSGKTLVNGVNGAVTIPAGVEAIGNDAFWGYDGLTSVTIPASVTQILFGAFFGCDGLTSVTIPASVTQIGDYAFEYCDGLKTVTFAGDCPDCGDAVYSGTPEDLVTYVPAGNATWAEALAAGTWKGRVIRAVSAEKYKVTFGKNGGTGGDNYVTATYGAAMPTPRTAPKLSGWTFAGYWDTLALDEKGNAKGKQYYDGSMKSVRAWDKTSATTLWAKWTNKVTFGKNGGTGGDNYVTCTKGQPMPKRTMPTKSGYVFDGYWTTTGAGGVKYYNADGTSAHVWDKGGSVTLWAKWVAAVQVKVTFGKNGGTGGDNYVTVTTGKAMPTPRTAPTLKGWSFGGYWDTLACDAKGNPLGKQYYNSKMESVRAWDKTAATTLWAKWTVKVTLGKNGGTGGDSTVTVIKGQPFPKRTMPTKSGYKFGGYFVSASSKTGQCYNPDGTGTSSMKWSTGGTPTIWALWTKTASCVELPPAVARRAASAAPSASAVPETAPQSAVSAGLYSGVLADGSGSFLLMLDELEEDAPRTAYLYVASEDGSLTAECTVEESDGLLILTTEDGKTFAVDPSAGIASFL